MLWLPFELVTTILDFRHSIKLEKYKPLHRFVQSIVFNGLKTISQINTIKKMLCVFDGITASMHAEQQMKLAGPPTKPLHSVFAAAHFIYGSCGVNGR